MVGLKNAWCQPPFRALGIDELQQWTQEEMEPEVTDSISPECAAAGLIPPCRIRGRNCGLLVTHERRKHGHIRELQMLGDRGPR